MAFSYPICEHEQGWKFIEMVGTSYHLGCPHCFEQRIVPDYIINKYIITEAVNAQVHVPLPNL